MMSLSEDLPQAVSEADPEKNNQLSRATSRHTNYEIPDGTLRGWLVVLALFMSLFVCWGGNLAFSIYLLTYIEHDTFHTTPVNYAVIGGLAFGSGLMFAPLITYLVGLTNENFVVFLGGILQFVALMTLSYVEPDELYALFLSQGLLMGIGLAMTTIPIPPLIPQWFDRYRGFVFLIGAGGTGLGGIMFSLAIQRIIDVKSIPWARRIQAIITICICTFCALIIKLRNDHIKPHFKMVDKQVLKKFPFWMAVGWLAFAMFGHVTTQYSITNLTVSRGYSAQQSSILIVIFSVGAVVGRPASGLLSDRFGAITVSMCDYALIGIFCLAMWIPARNLATMYVFAFIGGSTTGIVFGLMGAIIPRIVGLRLTPITFGLAWVVMGMSGIVSPIIGFAIKKEPPKGVTKDPTEYLYASIFCGLSFLMASFCLWVLRAYVIARDRIVGNKNSDYGHANVSVPPADVLKCFFTISEMKV